MANIDQAFTVDVLSLNDKVIVVEGAFDPSIGAGYEAPIGSLFLRSDISAVYQKTGANDTDWTLNGLGAAQTMLHRHNGAITQTLTATPVTILFNSNIRNDSTYTYGGGQVTINSGGWYEVSFDVSADGTAGNRSIGEFFLENNTVLVPGSYCYTYNRQASEGENTASSKVLINVASSDVLRVRGHLYGGSPIVTLANACRLTIKSLG